MSMGQRGFSLVELIVVAGAMAGLSLVTMNIFKQGAKTSTDLNVKQDARDFRDQFTIAVKSGSCGLVQTDLATTPIANFDIDDPNGLSVATLYTKQGVYSQGSVVGRLQIANTNAFRLAPPVTSSPLIAKCDPANLSAGGYCLVGGYRVAELTINLQKPASLGNGLIPLRFLLMLMVDDNKNITECKSISSINAAYETCSAMQTTNNSMIITWNENTLQCEVNTAPPAVIPDGTLTPTDPGTVDPAYIL